MLSSVDELRAATGGTDLADLDFRPGRDGSFAAVLPDPAPPLQLAVWRSARALTATTGRWPLLFPVADNNPPPNPLSASQVRRLRDLDALAPTVNPWTQFRLHPWELEGADDLRLYVPAVPGRDLAAEAVARLPLPIDLNAVDRWVYDKLIADPDLREWGNRRSDYLCGTEYWYTPHEGVALTLLPCQRPWQLADWLGYYGTCGHEDALAGALWEWHRRWGAEPVAAWGTMLQFSVARPPADPEDAWTVAGQIQSCAGSLQMMRWELALGISRSDTWFFHDRP